MSLTIAEIIIILYLYNIFSVSSPNHHAATKKHDEVASNVLEMDSMKLDEVRWQCNGDGWWAQLYLPFHSYSIHAVHATTFASSSAENQ